MSDMVGAHFGRLSGTHSHLVSTTSQMNGQLDDLERSIAPMVSTWTGEASQRYQQLHKQWKESAMDLNQILTQIGKALADANEQFSQTERSNANTFGG